MHKRFLLKFAKYSFQHESEQEAIKVNGPKFPINHPHKCSVQKQEMATRWRTQVYLTQWRYTSKFILNNKVIEEHY